VRSDESYKSSRLDNFGLINQLCSTAKQISPKATTDYSSVTLQWIEFAYSFYFRYDIGSLDKKDNTGVNTVFITGVDTRVITGDNT